MDRHMVGKQVIKEAPLSFQTKKVNKNPCPFCKFLKQQTLNLWYRDLISVYLRRIRHRQCHQGWRIVLTSIPPFQELKEEHTLRQTSGQGDCCSTKHSLCDKIQLPCQAIQILNILYKNRKCDKGNNS